MMSTRSGKSWITSIVQTTILNLRLTSGDITIVIASRQITHTYKQLYHSFSQRPRNNQEVMDGN